MTATTARPGAGATTTTGEPTPSARRQPHDCDRAVDIDVGGLVTIRLVGATATDRSAVERQFGRARPITDRSPHLEIRYVERIDDDAPLRYLGPGEQGFTTDHFYVLRGRFRRPVRVRLPLGDGSPAVITCEHGVGRVPHLVALVNLAVLRAGGVALHASAFAIDGRALVATGWSKGGKTEALLAATRVGARYVADEWAHLHPGGTVTGIREPVRLWDWHLDQLPDLRSALPSTDRRRLAALRYAHRLAGTIGASHRWSTAIDRHRHVDAPPELIDGGHPAREPVPVAGVILMTSAEQPSCSLHALGTDEVADRMAASLAYERLALCGLLAAHRYAFPGTATTSVDELESLERERLRRLWSSIPAVEVRHPHHVDLRELGSALLRVNEGWT